MNTGSSRWIAYASSVVPPPTEKNQKWRGTTLFFARSDAIHWTRKRAEKNAWPSRPMPSHTCSVVIVATPGDVDARTRARTSRAGRCTPSGSPRDADGPRRARRSSRPVGVPRRSGRRTTSRSEEHTSELQSLAYLVCRLLLEKKKKQATH